MADNNKDGFDDLTHQQVPVVNPQVANTVPAGTNVVQPTPAAGQVAGANSVRGF